MKGKEHDFKKVKIGISGGDFNSIAPEVTLKSFQDNRIYQFVTPLLYSSAKVMSYHKKALQLEHINHQVLNDEQKKSLKEKMINVLDVFDENIIVNIGQSSKQAGANALKAIDACLNDLKDGQIDAMVTAPIDKSSIELKDKKFSGHTEYISDYFSVSESLMLLVGDRIKIGLQSNHLPLEEVAASINTGKILKKLELLNKSLERDFAIHKPKIAVFGLNPHAGDGGLLGKEEKEQIIPAIEKAKEAGILAFGPYPADGFMGAGSFNKFDAVLAMYHDQGLVAFKTLEFGQGVNYTAGLPFVRTSPDHGTAFDIAGKGEASPDSMRAAILLARDIVLNRKAYEESIANPLRKTAEK
ncbi:MAG: 4-hydroxythreonine-4-phosphate dehydrogenase PdxA [Chitinophagales bacterium]